MGTRETPRRRSANRLRLPPGRRSPRYRLAETPPTRPSPSVRCSSELLAKDDSHVTQYTEGPGDWIYGERVGRQRRLRRLAANWPGDASDRRAMKSLTCGRSAVCFRVAVHHRRASAFDL